MMIWQRDNYVALYVMRSDKYVCSETICRLVMQLKDGFWRHFASEFEALHGDM
jgi:hypothetical protein